MTKATAIPLGLLGALVLASATALAFEGYASPLMGVLAATYRFCA